MWRDDNGFFVLLRFLLSSDERDREDELKIIGVKYANDN
jgi:hypothetical protein